MCRLLEVEKNIINKGHGIGNQVLYDFCKKYSLSSLCEMYQSLSKEEQNERKDGLAAQLWLIGRSYAASPERRDYGVPLTWTNSGDGLDSYFGLLADKLLSEQFRKRKNGFDDIIKLLTNSPAVYTFNNRDADKEILSSTIQAVLYFNELLKEVRLNVDFGEDEDSGKMVFEESIKTLEKKILNNPEGKEANKKLEQIKTFYEQCSRENNLYETLKCRQKNMISFSSKFLHFHFPDKVFIIDTISTKNLKNTFEFRVDDEIQKSNLSINKIRKNQIKDCSLLNKIKYTEIENDNEKEIDYIKHCINEYMVAEKINELSHKEGINVLEDKYIPRAVDTYVLFANSGINVNR